MVIVIREEEEEENPKAFELIESSFPSRWTKHVAEEEAYERTDRYASVEGARAHSLIVKCLIRIRVQICKNALGTCPVGR